MEKTSPPPIRLDSFWAYQVVVLADQVSRYTLEVVRSEADLNQSQWRVLAAVADKPGRSAAEVTAVTPMDKTIVSRAVASLIKDGLIKRTPNKEDKRVGALEMTQLGQDRYVLISEKLAETLNAARIGGQETQAFNADVKAFSRYMAELAERLKSDAPAA
jgi:DNA-binding MarR family transcriptional regulator